jgi:transposase
MDVALMLPDLNALDPDALKALLIEQHEKYTATLTSRSGEIERLKLLVEKLQRMLFGTKSEKVMRQIEQLELQLEELQAASAIEENAAILPSEKPVTAKPFRRPLPEHLPREIHTHMPDHGKRVVLAGCTSGGAGFRMIVCLKRSLSWMG